MPRSTRRRPRLAAAWLFGAGDAIAIATAAPFGSSPGAPSARQAQAAAEEQHARVTCGGCHAFPPPEILPRSAWRDEFVRMMFIREKRLPPIGPPGKVYSTVPLP